MTSNRPSVGGTWCEPLERRTFLSASPAFPLAAGHGNGGQGVQLDAYAQASPTD